MRIAFVTPEFITDYPDGGGLGNYLNRIGKVLVDQGHQPEIFVSSDLEPRILMLEGIRVERVPPFSRRLWARILGRMFRVAGDHWRDLFSSCSQSLALAEAMERRHRKLPFDIVQSADCLAVGLAVRRAKGRVHLVRCSGAADLYNEVDGCHHRDARWQERLERAAIRRADKAYAPSQFVAEHFQTRHRIPVEVLRPPLGLEVAPSAGCPCGLPERFFVHFGQLIRRKGTDWLGESLKRVFEVEPSLRMVWVGRGDFTEVGTLLSGLGRHRSKVQVLYPLPKPELYWVLQHADAAVLPSLVDNLPNTVIESLMMGIPVIGTRGASIDELVEQGVTGELVAPGDVEGLASAMVRVWRGQSPVRKGFAWRGGVVDEMQPERAVEKLLQMAGARNSESYSLVKNASSDNL